MAAGDRDRIGEHEVAAAGGVVWRAVGDRLEVLLVHRPRYDDWTLPKGKLDPGESWEQAAVREVWEETGIESILGAELLQITYRDQNGRPKRVRYWAMTVRADHGFTPDDEVGARAWLAVADAGRRCTYDRDRQVLASFTATR